MDQVTGVGCLMGVKTERKPCLYLCIFFVVLDDRIKYETTED